MATGQWQHNFVSYLYMPTKCIYIFYIRLCQITLKLYTQKNDANSDCFEPHQRRVRVPPFAVQKSISVSTNTKSVMSLGIVSMALMRWTVVSVKDYVYF